MFDLRKVIGVVSAASILLAAATGVTGCDSRREIIVYNWGEYIADETIDMFEAAYPQYKVVYRTFETNETMYPNLDNTYDVIVPSEYMVCRLINEERLQPLDWSQLPNVSRYMDPVFRSLQYAEDKNLSDEILDYAIPYLYVTVGLVYDASRIDIPEDSTDPQIIWGALFDEGNAQQIGMYDSMRESIGVALNYLGYSINSTDDGELTEALNLLIEQKININPTYGIDNLKDKIVSGELSAMVTWAGDHIIILDRMEELGRDSSDIKFALPQGSNWSVDMMCIPTNAVNYEGAHDFINFMYDPEVALLNCEYVGYSTPNTAAREMLDPEISGNIYYYPTEEVFASLEVYYTSAKIEERYTNIWNTVKASA